MCREDTIPREQRDDPFRGRVAAARLKAGRELECQLSSDMAAAQAGDPTAYQRLLRGILLLLPPLIRRQRVSSEQVEDIVQDTLLTIHRVRDTYDPERPLVPWLAAIAHRRAIDARRRLARINTWEQVSPDQLETLPDPQADRLVELIDLYKRQKWLHRALTHLPRKQREAVALMKIRGLSVAEAAVVSGQSLGAIKVNMYRAQQALRALAVRTRESGDVLGKIKVPTEGKVQARHPAASRRGAV
jgi:RNA polymerase sigma factor (sigma-70 family)